MKYIKSLLVSTFVLLACLSLHAQSALGFAGEDKKTVHLSDNSQQVEIGLPDDDPTHCYEWSGPNILTDPHKPVITVNPQEPMVVYTVTRHSTCAPETDQVVVSMVDTIGIVSVTPLKDCYNDGDPVDISDFEIVTDPPGFGSLATVTPDHARNSWGGIVDPTDFTIRLTYGNYTSSRTVTVDVYNEGLEISIGTSLHLNKVKNTLQTLRKVIENAKNLANLVSKTGGVLPCDLEFDASLNIPDEQWFKACCNGNELTGYRMSGFSFTPSLNLDCYIPIPYVSFPKAGGLSAHLGLGYGMEFGPVSYAYKGECTGGVSVDVRMFVRIAGGVEFSLLSRDILSAQADLEGIGSASFRWTLGESCEFSGVQVDIDLVGKVTFLSFLTEEVRIPVYSHLFGK